jgi:hypothetical protein
MIIMAIRIMVKIEKSQTHDDKKWGEGMWN